MKLLAKIEHHVVAISQELPKLSEDNKRLLVKVWPWVALIFGMLQLLSLTSLWEAMMTIQRLDIYKYAIHDVNAFSITMAYIHMALLLVMALLLLLAYAPLKARARRGWELLLTVGVINAATALVAIFTRGQGFGSMLFSLLVSMIIFYLLVQVRDYYTVKGRSEKSIVAEKTTKKE